MNNNKIQHTADSKAWIKPAPVYSGTYVSEKETEKAICIKAIYCTCSSSLGTRERFVWIPKSQAKLIGETFDGQKVYSIADWIIRKKRQEIPAKIGYFDFLNFWEVAKCCITKWAEEQ